MKKITACVLFLFLSSTFPYICYSGAPPTERPIYSAGDYWVFINHRGKESKIEFLREENNNYVFNKKKNMFSNEGDDIIKDFELTKIDKKTKKGYPGPIIKFPLKVGKKWNYRFQSKGAVPLRILAQYKVETYEEITVTGGTFWAFKISASREPTNAPRGRIIMTEVTYYWYSPKVKQIIKKEWKGKGKYSELKEYKIK